MIRGTVGLPSREDGGKRIAALNVCALGGAGCGGARGERGAEGKGCELRRALELNRSGGELELAAVRGGGTLVRELACWDRWARPVATCRQRGDSLLRLLRDTADWSCTALLRRFIGNSVSTFAALALLERRHRGQWAAYYNGGNLPIAPYLPVHKLPWVFTYNSWSEKYDYMLKGAVK